MSKKDPIQYKGFTINYLRGKYRADAYASPQFTNTNLAKLKKEINEYLKDESKGGSKYADGGKINIPIDVKLKAKAMGVSYPVTVDGNAEIDVKEIDRYIGSKGGSTYEGGGEIWYMMPKESNLDDYKLWGVSPLVAKITNSKGDKGFFGLYKLVGFSEKAFGNLTYWLVPFGVFRVVDEEKKTGTIDFITKKEDVWRFDTHWIPKNAWIKADNINFDEWNFTKDQLEKYKIKNDAERDEVINNATLKFQNSFEGGGEIKNHSDIVKLIESSDTYMTLYDEDEKDLIMYSTRENGNVGEELASDKDIDEAIRLKRIVESKFNNVVVEVEEVDEWVHLNIRPIQKATYRYNFHKHSTPSVRSSGFTETYDTMNEMIKKRGTFVGGVNWEKVKKELENIIEYPNNKFTGWYDSEPILISKPSDNGNDWGYFFSVSKSENKNEYSKGGSTYAEGGGVGKSFSEILIDAERTIDGEDKTKDLQGQIGNIINVNGSPTGYGKLLSVNDEEATFEATQNPYYKRWKKEGKYPSGKKISQSLLDMYDKENKRVGEIFTEPTYFAWNAFFFENGGSIYAEGGEITEVNEDGSNLPKPLYDLFTEMDLDRLGDYSYMEELRVEANEIGYDFNYDLSGEVTEFWEIDKMEKGGSISISTFNKMRKLSEKIAKEYNGNDNDLQEIIDEYSKGGSNYAPMDSDYKKEEEVIDFAKYSSMDDINVNGKSGFVLSNDTKAREIVVEFYDNNEMEVIKYKQGGNVGLDTVKAKGWFSGELSFLNY